MYADESVPFPAGRPYRIVHTPTSSSGPVSCSVSAIGHKGKWRHFAEQLRALMSNSNPLMGDKNNLVKPFKSFLNKLMVCVPVKDEMNKHCIIALIARPLH